MKSRKLTHDDFRIIHLTILGFALISPALYILSLKASLIDPLWGILAFCSIPLIGSMCIFSAVIIAIRRDYKGQKQSQETHSIHPNQETDSICPNCSNKLYNAGEIKGVMMLYCKICGYRELK